MAIFKPREKQFRRNQLCRHLNLRFIAPGTVTKEISVVDTTQSVVLGDGSPNRLMHWLQSLCLLADTNKLQKGFFGIKRISVKQNEVNFLSPSIEVMVRLRWAHLRQREWSLTVPMLRVNVTRHREAPLQNLHSLLPCSQPTSSTCGRIQGPRAVIPPPHLPPHSLLLHLVLTHKVYTADSPPPDTHDEIHYC